MAPQVRLTQPAAGTTVTHVIDAPNMQLGLGFEPDPNGVEKVGENLEFNFADGGKIVLEGYYTYFTDKTLPTMVMDDGTELPGELFLASFNNELLTAAGPAAAASAPSGGQGEYADHPGSMVDGVDRLGSLGTDYWGRNTEISETYTSMPAAAALAAGLDVPPLNPTNPVIPIDPIIPIDPVDPRDPEVPGGEVNVSVKTDVNGIIYGGLFEDSRPDQHLYGNAAEQHYGQLNFSFTPTGSTVVDAVHMQGFHEGTRIYIGDPAAGNFIDVTGPDQIITLTPQQLAGGVYLLPPANSDLDMSITTTVDVHAESSGLASTVTGPSFTIIVDAVADLPVIDGSFAPGVEGGSHYGGAVNVTEAPNAEQRFEDGFAKDALSATGGAQNISIPVQVTATFRDYGENNPADVSEQHFVLIAQPGAAADGTQWTCTYNGTTYGSGNVVMIWTDPASGQPVDQFNPPAGAVQQGFFKIPVDNALLQANGGTVDIAVTLNNPTFYQGLGNDTSIRIWTGAMADEGRGEDGELRADNNVSYTFGGSAITVPVNVVTSALNVNLGWFYEDGDGTKHGDSAHTPGASYASGSNDGASAKVDIHLGNPGAGEYIGSATLTYDSKLGSMHFADPLPTGWTVTESTNPTTGITTVTISTSGQPVSLEDLGAVFRPVELDDNVPGFSDGDIPIHYDVTVIDGSSGASAGFHGNSIVRVDAVADLPASVEIDKDYGGDHTAAVPGGTVAVSGSAAFPDNDGSEHHYLVVSMENKAGWAIDGLAPNSLLGKDAINSYWNGDTLGKGLLPDTVLQGILGDGAGGSNQFLLIEAYMDGSGWHVQVFAAGPGGLVDVTQALTDAGAVFTFTPGTGELSYTINVVPPYSGDSSVILENQAVTLEVPGDGEYDYANNIATVGKDKTITVIDSDESTARLNVSLQMDEGGQSYQHQDESGKGGSLTDAATGDQNTSGGLPEFGVKIDMNLVEADGSSADATDKVTSITFTTVPTAEQGAVYYKGDLVKVGDTIDNPDLNAFTFKPAPNYSGTPDLGITAEIESLASGHQGGEHSAVHVVDDGQGTVTVLDPEDLGSDFHGYAHVDSVADLADATLATGRESDGKVIIVGNEGQDTFEKGWHITHHGAEESYTVKATLNVAFGDTDGSESGTILIKAQEGVKIVDPAGDGSTFLQANADGYWEINLGKITGTSSGTIDLTVVVDTDYKDTVGKLQVYVKTEEIANNNPNDNSANDTAIREVKGGISMPTLESTFDVKVGWAYEGNDGTKHGGAAGTPADLAGALGGEFGVPVNVALSEANGEKIASGDIYFSYKEGSGDFYWNGTLYKPLSATPDANGFLTIKVNYNQAHGGKLTFLPNSGYSDGDIELTYKVAVTDTKEGANFIISGKTTVVIDAVADLARVMGTQTAAGDDNTSVVIGVKAAFADNDVAGARSEGHYVLVEARAGWTCANAETVTLFVDPNGKPLPPTGYDTATQSYIYNYPAETKEMIFFKVDVTGKAPAADGSYKVTLTPPADATDLKGLTVGTLVVEEHISGREYNYQNNQAGDVTKIDVNVMDSGLHGTTQVVYEDRMPNAHAGNVTLDTSASISLSIGKGAGGSVNGGEYLDTATGKEITITFNVEGTPAEIAALLAEGTFTLGSHTTALGAIHQNPDGSFSVSIPASAAGSGTVTTLGIRYNPPLDQDNDLTNVTVTAPVTNAEGFTDKLTSSPMTIVVDAVADKPLAGAKDAVTGIDGKDAASWEATWGSKVNVTVDATFNDRADGSEKHYLMVEAKAGWTCSNPGVVTVTLYYDTVGNLLYPNAGTGTYPTQAQLNAGATSKSFFALDADSVGYDAGGNASAVFQLTAPANAGATNAADAAAIQNDGGVKLATGGMALEGTVTEGKLDVAAGKSGFEARYDNNLSFTNEGVTVDFNVVNTGKAGTSSGAFEDHDANKHGGTTVAPLANDGGITIALNDPSGKDVFTKGGSNTITFEFKGSGAPGSFSYTEGGATKYATVTGPDASGKYTVDIPDAAISADGRTVNLTYNPPAFDNTDLTNVSYTIDVHSTNSNATGSVTGGIDTIYGGTTTTGTVVVDAVADKPSTQAIATGDIDYGTMDSGSKAAAATGETVNVNVTVTFRDITEGGEQHYLAIKNAGWKSCTVDGMTSVSGSTVPEMGNGYTLVSMDTMIGKALAAYRAEGSPTLGSSGYTYTDANGITIILKTDPANGQMMAEVHTTVNVTVPDSVTVTDPATGGSTIPLEVGGVAVDRDNTTSDGKGLATGNDVARDMTTTPINVQQIASVPSVGMGKDSIYENLTPNAHIPADYPGGIANHPDYVNAADGQGAEITISNIKLGETAAVTLYFSNAHAGKDIGDLGNATITVGDVDYAIIPNPAVAGGWMTEIPVVITGIDNGTDVDATLVFKPGDNYASGDIKISYDITVTDNATGAQKTWTTDDKPASGADPDTSYGQSTKEIIVDAVAQRPEFGDATDNASAHGRDDKGTPNDPSDDSFTPLVQPGSNIYIKTSLVFQDVTDGSQEHFLLVEAKPDSMFKPQSVTLSYTDAQGNPATIVIDGTRVTLSYIDADGQPATTVFNDHLTYVEQLYGDGMYYRIDVSKYLTNVQGVDGEHSVNVTFELNSYGDSTDTQIRVGAVAHEREGAVISGGEHELTTDNNTAFTVSNPIDVNFGRAPTFNINRENWVSENDTPTANLDYTPQAQGGCILGITLSDGSGSTSHLQLTQLTFTDLPQSNVGTLYYIPSGSYGDVSSYSGHEVTGTVTPHDGYVLVFVPAHNYSDKDIPVFHYSGTVKNTDTGQSATVVDGEIKVYVDAVAQKPTVESITDEQGNPLKGLELKHDTNTAQGSNITQKTAPITITGTFPDPDGETHYALVKVLPNMGLTYDKTGNGDWVSCTETFLHNDDVYYKIPMPNNGSSVDVMLEFLSHKLYGDVTGTSSDTAALQILVMTEEQVSNSSGNREQNYDNNMAVSDGSGIVIEHQWVPGDTIWIDPNYENNTPNADKDGPAPGQQPDDTLDITGGKIHFGSTVEKFELTVNDDLGAIYIKNADGSFTKVSGTSDGNGNTTYTVTSGQDAYFKPTAEYGNKDGFNWNDADVNVSYKAYDASGACIAGSDGGSKFPVVVDAVAQLPKLGGVSLDYDKETPGTDNDRWTAVGKDDGSGNNGLVVITIKGGFEDSDGSEAHYGLLKKVPGYTIVDENGTPLAVETVYLPTGANGAIEAYYRVDMKGGNSIAVTVKVEENAFGSDRQFTIETGVMNEEKNYGGIVDGKIDGEVRVDNNISWSVDGSTTIKFSPVNTTINLTVADTWEHDGVVNGVQTHTGGQIAIAVAVDQYDVLNSLVLDIPASGGHVVYKTGGVETSIPGKYLTAEGDVDLFALLKDEGLNLADLCKSGQSVADINKTINDKLASLGLRYVTEGYGDTDLSGFTIKAGVTDSHSGDAASVTGQDSFIIDAVAHAPILGGTPTSGSIAGSTAAESGDKLTAEVNLTFEDIGQGEEHYAILGQHHQWPCTGVSYFQDGEWKEGQLLTLFDKNGKPYYALKIADDMFETGESSIKVAFTVQAPGSDADISQIVKIGGASVETNMGSPADRETNLLNNWADNATDVTLSVGVVETKNATLTMAPTNEDTATQMTFTLTGDHNDSIQSVTIDSLNGGKIVDAGGAVLFEGTSPVTLDGATAQAGGYYFLPAQNVHGNYTLNYSVTVQDNASGTTKTFPESGTANSSVYVTAIADMPTGVDVLPEGPGAEVTYADGTAAKPGAAVTFKVTATFPDHDGSETHYILVEAKPGWTCPGATAVDGYFRIPVTSGYDANGKVTQTVTMNAPSNATADEAVPLKVGAMSQENTSVATVDDTHMDSVTINIGAVQSSAATVTIGATVAAEDALGVNGSQLQFTLDNAVSDNETITGITVSNLNGGRIFDSHTSQYLTGGSPVLDAAGAQNGRYYYEPAANVSGDVALSFSVTVKDNASGATKSFTDTATVSVTPVTDIPTGAAGSNSAAAVQNGHTATTTVTLSADFKDYDGSETHFFLVKLPAGATVVSGASLASDAIKAAAGMTGDVYMVNTASSASGSGALNLKLSGDFEPSAIEYKAGSYEQALPDGDPAKYQFSPAAGDGAATHTINADGDTFNKAPTLGSPATPLNYLRDADGKVDGTLSKTDADGDAVVITGVKTGNGGFVTEVKDGFITVHGQYGDLKINTTTGAYEYTMLTKPSGVVSEVFTVQGSDGYGPNPLTGSGTITISLTDKNSAPTAESQYASSGGGNEGDLVPTTGTFVTHDADGDAVTITGFTLNGAQAIFNAQTSEWEATGQYGTFTMKADGTYTYTRTDKFQTGEETITVSFKDAYGATGSGSLTIDAKGVNHAPDVADVRVFYDDASASSITGMLDLKGTLENPVDSDGDTVTVTSITYNGTTYAVTADTWTTGIRPDGADFTLKVSADGSYMFTPDSEVLTGTGHSFTYTVSDGSLTDSAMLFFGKGDEAIDFPHGRMAAASYMPGADSLEEAGVHNGYAEGQQGFDVNAETHARHGDNTVMDLNIFGSGGSGGSDTLDGGDSLDTLDYSDVLEDLVIDLTSGLVYAHNGDGIPLWTDSVSNFEVFKGSSDNGSDVFKWTSDAASHEGDTWTDVIKNFTWLENGEQDTIDLTELGLSDPSALTAGCTADGYLEMSFETPGGGTQVIVFEGISCTDTTTAEQLIAEMLEMHQIKLVTG